MTSKIRFTESTKYFTYTNENVYQQANCGENPLTLEKKIMLFFKPLFKKTRKIQFLKLRYKQFFWNRIILDSALEQTHPLDYTAKNWAVVHIAATHKHLIYDTSLILSYSEYLNKNAFFLRIKQMFNFMHKTIINTLKNMNHAFNNYFVNFMLLTTNNSLLLKSSDSTNAISSGLIPNTNQNDFAFKCLLGGLIITSTGLICYFYGPMILSAVTGFFRPDGGSATSPTIFPAPAANSIDTSQLLPQIGGFITDTMASTNTMQLLVEHAPSAVSTQQVFGGAIAITMLRASGTIFTTILNSPQPQIISEFDLLWIKELQLSAYLEAQEFLFHRYEPTQGHVFENLDGFRNMLRIRADLPIPTHILMRPPEQAYFEKLLSFKVRGPIALQELLNLILIKNNVNPSSLSIQKNSNDIYAFYEQMVRLYPQFGR